MKYIIRRIVTTVLFVSATFIISVNIAIVIVRLLPITRFLSSQNASFNSVPGASFVNAVYCNSRIPIGSRRSLPLPSLMLPVFVAIAICRKVFKPVDNFIGRLFPRSSPDETGYRLSDAELPTVDTESFLQAGEAFSNSRRLNGNVAHSSLSLLFLLILIICILLTSLVIQKILKESNQTSKEVIATSAHLSKEIRELPSVLKEIYGEEKLQEKKSSIKKRKTTNKKA